MLVACKDLRKAFGADNVLEGISFIIEEKEKAAIVGANGAGKTTLFKLITGELAPDAGEVTFPKAATMGCLAQTPDFTPEHTVYQEILTVFEPVTAMEKELRRLEADMANHSGDLLEGLMKRYDALTLAFERAGGFEYESRARGVIKGLGFTDADQAQPVGTFSGGQKTRLAMAKLLLRPTDLLLLDEPTNHLDIEATAWLEDFLRGYDGAVAVISHDRYFLDKVVTKVIEIDRGKSVTYNGDYTRFAAKKAEDRQQALKRYSDQRKEIKKQEDTIRLLKSFNREKTVKRAESREKALAKVERLERPAEDASIHMRLQPLRESGNDVLTAEGLAKSFDGKPLFQGVSFQAHKADKIALVGPNGVGKTTLLRIILGARRPDSGSIRLGAGVTVGYYDQEHQNIDPRKTIFQEMSDAHPRQTASAIRAALAAFMFTGDDVFRRIETLSGGERGRVALARIMLGGPNLLILDEPTNHLDIFSKEVLEDAVKGYGGTVLYVSHDRYFMNATATTVLELTPVGVRQYLGNYDDMLEKKRVLQQETPDQRPVSATQEQPQAKNNWLREKEASALERKRQARIKRAEADIAQTETDMAALDEMLAAPELCADHERLAALYRQRVELEARLDGLYETWQALTDE